MKIFIIAGEASGDLQASLLVESLYKQYPDAEIMGWGGDLMKSKGVQILKHVRELAFMGFVEVVKHLGEILSNFKLCKEQIEEENPDLVILVDYPGFNLRLVPWLDKKDYTFSYYISPQVWAWKEGRVKKIKKFIPQMICILPFEKEFYNRHDYRVEYVGHPLLEVIPAYREEHQKLEKKYIALLPGSRKQEVENNLDVMMEACMPYKDSYPIAIAKSPNLNAQFYQDSLQKYPFVQLFEEGSYALLAQSKVALVTSGTATLETALFKVPQVVCYRSNPVSVWLARKLIKVNYISLVNLIMDEELIPELIQQDFNVENLESYLSQLMDESNEYRKSMLAGYGNLYDRLWEGAPPTKLAVEQIKKLVSSKS